MKASITQQQADKFAKWSEAILAKFVQTGSMREAVDAVLGEGTHSALAGDLYDALRARSAA